MRQPFQGVWNIIRFNWHFYLFSIGAILIAMLVSLIFDKTIQEYLYIVCILAGAPILISLLTSFYVYDLSGLYSFNWFEIHSSEKLILNVHAGFDETSEILKQKFAKAELMVFDFYNPLTHTEISIKRARKAYPSYVGTKEIETSNLPLSDMASDKVFLIFSAHEIRNNTERIAFFKETNRILKSDGQVIVVEHLRDFANFLAYNVGFFHFHSRKTWYQTFSNAGFKIKSEEKFTPFISTFILEKNGNTP